MIALSSGSFPLSTNGEDPGYNARLMWQSDTGLITEFYLLKSFLEYGNFFDLHVL